MDFVVESPLQNVVGSDVDIATHGKQVTGSEVDTAQHAATEVDKIVISADCTTRVGRKDRWSRVANGKGKELVDKKRDRDATSRRGSCRKSI